MKIYGTPKLIDVNPTAGATLRVFAASPKGEDTPTSICIMFDVEDKDFSVGINVMSPAHLALLMNALSETCKTVWGQREHNATNW